jgi:selenocysteine-specific elongation factor
MYIIGTAGHVDHGKSTLIEAITGTHPDRLQEERERELSIVLGFDSMKLESGEEVGVIDVPGHRDFIENMLSGIGGIDAVLFVVAADEGVMPQTEEHLAIVDLLGIEDGVVALTKVDVVDDPDWLDLVEMDLRESLQGTTLADAPILRVSGKTGLGVKELVRELENTLSRRTPRPDLGRPRLSIDRAFTMPGFGTVVTGTLLDGVLKVGEEIVLLPEKVKGRIRGLQVHKKEVETAYPGSRTAINISGVDVDDIKRGDVVAHPGDYQPTRRLDVRFQLLPDAMKPLTHNAKAKLFIGADEVMARVRLLGEELLQPGHEGWLQLELPEAVVALRGDHYILRRPSPSETMGGGVVLDPQPAYRHKRFDEEVLNRLRALWGGDPVDILWQIVRRSGVVQRKVLLTQSSLDVQTASEALEALIEGDEVIPVNEREAPIQLLAESTYWEGLLDRLIARVEAYHGSYPLRIGMPSEELKSQSSVADDVFQAGLRYLSKEGRLVQKGPVVALPSHEIAFTPGQRERIEDLMKKFREAPYAPPTVDECLEMVGEEVYNALVSMGELKPVSTEVVFKQDMYEKMVSDIKTWLEEKGTITVAEARDHFDSSRRYMLDFLEYLDQEGVTVREGDIRRLR